MASMWFLLQILVIFFYRNLHEFNTAPTLSVNSDERSPLLADSTDRSGQNTTNQEQPDIQAVSSENEQEAGNQLAAAADPSIERSMQRSAPKSSSGSQKYDRIRVVDNSETGHILVRLYEQYIREEIVTVYTTTFTVFFMQTSLEVSRSSIFP